MQLAADIIRQLDNPTLSRDERALIRCEAAAVLIHAGQYEAARDALGELWARIGERPHVEGLKRPATRAEVLLQSGVLTGWLGSARNISGSQEAAKDLISEAQRMFESLKQTVKVAEAQYELGICYWRIGAFDEARTVLAEAVRNVGDKDDALKAKALIRRSLIETWAGRYHDALDVLGQAELFFAGLNDAFQGRWHGQMGSVLRHLGAAEGRADYLDRAVIEYTAAIYHYEQAGHERYCAVNLNNLAMLLYRAGRYAEAHEHIDRAAAIFSRLKDEGNLAQVNETRARVLMAEQRYAEAEKTIRSSIHVFENSGEQWCLADALTIHATALSRLGQHERSVAIFRRAIDVSAQAGCVEKAGRAALGLIEEHNKRLSEVDLFETYRRANGFLKDTQDKEDIDRLRECSITMGRRLLGAQLSDADFSLPDAVRAYEARFIERALEQAEGSVTRAARLLGFSHHSTLAKLLEGRHRQLMAKRTPAVPRISSRRRAVRKRGRSGRAEHRLPAQRITILHAEDNSLVAGAVKETLEMEGWNVGTISDGASALRALQSDAAYDVLIFDNELPGMEGLELIRRARRSPRHQHTPIVMLSASDIEQEAMQAGADVFLRKPEQINAITETIARLLQLRGS